MLALVPGAARAAARAPACRAGSPRRSPSRSPRRSAPRRSIALHFERLSLVSLPANVLAAPAVAPVMWLGTIAGALGQVAPGARGAGRARSRRCRSAYLTWLADRAAALPFAELAIRSPGPLGACSRPTLAAAAAALAWRRLAARRAARRRARRAARAAPARRAAVALLASPIGAASRSPRARRQPPRDLTISFLDVGQGDATLIQHGARRGARRHRPARRADPRAPARRRRAAPRPARRSRTPRSTTTAPPPRCSSELPVGDRARRRGGRRAHRRVGAAGPFGARAAEPVARLARAPRPARRSDAGQVLRAGPLELRVLWPRRDPPAPPAPSPTTARRSSTCATATSTCCSPPTPSPTSRPALEPARRSRRSRSPTTAATTPACPTSCARLRPRVAVDPGRRAQPLRPPDAGDARRARARPSRSCAAPTATAPCGCACATGGSAVQPVDVRTAAAPRLAAVADLQARLPHPRRRPRPHRRAPRGAARARRARVGLATASSASRATPRRPTAIARALDAMTFAIGRRFLVVDGVERWKDADVNEHLVPALQAIAPDTTIAFFGREEGRFKVCAGARRARSRRPAASSPPSAC